MNNILNKNKILEKIGEELCKLNKHTVNFIKFGANLFITLFASGTLLSVLNRFIFNHNPYKEFLAISIITSSFVLLAEVIIGCLLLDTAFNK
jgi:hypothetical protein